MAAAAQPIDHLPKLFITSADVEQSRAELSGRVQEFRALCNTHLQASRKGFSGWLVYALRDREGTIGKILAVVREWLCRHFPSLELKRKEQEILIEWERRDVADERDCLLAPFITLQKFSWGDEFGSKLASVSRARGVLKHTSSEAAFNRFLDGVPLFCQRIKAAPFVEISELTTHFASKLPKQSGMFQGQLKQAYNPSFFGFLLKKDNDYQIRLFLKVALQAEYCQLISIDPKTKKFFPTVDLANPAGPTPEAQPHIAELNELLEHGSAASGWQIVAPPLEGFPQ